MPVEMHHGALIHMWMVDHVVVGSPMCNSGQGEMGEFEGSEFGDRDAPSGVTVEELIARQREAMSTHPLRLQVVSRTQESYRNVFSTTNVFRKLRKVRAMLWLCHSYPCCDDLGGERRKTICARLFFSFENFRAGVHVGGDADVDKIGNGGSRCKRSVLWL
mgnify:CR=1 FL=1